MNGNQRWATRSYEPTDPDLIQSLVELRNTFTVSNRTVREMAEGREMGRFMPRRSSTPRGIRRVPSSPYNVGNQVDLINMHLPNQRDVIERLPHTKVFCCLCLPQNRIVTASQALSRQIRFHEYDLGRRKYVPFAGIETEQEAAAAGRIIRKRREWTGYDVPSMGFGILDIAVDSTCSRLAYVTWDEDVRYSRIGELEETMYFNTIFGIQPHPPRSSRFGYFSIRFSMDDLYIIAAGSDGFIHMFSHEEPHTQLFQAHLDDVNALHCGIASPNIFFTGGDDGLCKVWDTRSLNPASPVGVFAGHRGGITYIDGHRNDNYILTNSKDQTIKIWDLRKTCTKDAEKATLEATRRYKWDYRYQAVPKVFANLEPLKGDGSVLTLRGHEVRRTLIRAKFSPERTGYRYVYTGSPEGGDVYIFDLATGECIQKLGGHGDVVRDCCWHPDECEIITTGWDGEVARWYHSMQNL